MRNRLLMSPSPGSSGMRAKPMDALGKHGKARSDAARPDGMGFSLNLVRTDAGRIGMPAYGVETNGCFKGTRTRDSIRVRLR